MRWCNILTIGKGSDETTVVEDVPIRGRMIRPRTSNRVEGRTSERRPKVYFILGDWSKQGVEIAEGENLRRGRGVCSWSA